MLVLRPQQMNALADLAGSPPAAAAAPATPPRPILKMRAEQVTALARRARTSMPVPIIAAGSPPDPAGRRLVLRPEQVAALRPR